MLDTVYLTTWAVALIPWALAFGVVMLLDAVTGAMLAWYNDDFSWEVMPRFLQTGVIYFWAWITSEILGAMPVVLSVEIPTYGDALALVGPKTVYAAIVVSKYVASIGTNVKRILEIRRAAPWDQQEVKDYREEILP